MFRQRIRICYGVSGRQRFLSHRDVMRSMIRALRRTRLPLRLSEGFHVRPKVSFALARGVGIASEAEYMEFELNDWVDPQLVRRRLDSQFPEGFRLRDLRAVYPDQRAIVDEIVYRIELPGPVEGLQGRVEDMLAQETLDVDRGEPDRPRQVNIRPLLRSLQVTAPDRLTLAAASSDEGTLRVEEILGALGLQGETIARSLIVRERTHLSEQ